MSTGITYTTMSMNQVSELAETIGAKQVTGYKQTTESFEVVKIRNDNNQFNITVTNTGTIPVHLTRLWVENTTDSLWPVSKFELDFALAPGNTTRNIGQNIGLTALDTQSYYMQLISERGNQKPVFLNSVGETALFLRSTAIPAVLPTTFVSTISLEVINTGTSQLLNLQPEMKDVTATTCTLCTFAETQSVMPTSFDSLDPGDTAIFEWAYSFTGENGDQLEFTTGLLNDVRNDTFTITLQTIESSLNADVAVVSGGLGDQVIIDDDILLFHAETVGTPTGEYQMWSGVADAGGSPRRVQLDQSIPNFFTNNGSSQIIIPEGDWDVALMLRSEATPRSLIGEGHDLIFHFEDGDDVPPDNSEGDSSRDLEECGITSYAQEITSGGNDAEEFVSSGFVTTTSSDLELASEGGGNQKIIGLRFLNVPAVQGTTINSATIEFQVDETNWTGDVHLRIYAEDVDDAVGFTDINSSLSNRPLTGNYTDWNITSQWTPGSTIWTTSDITNIIQEVVDRQGWSSGHDIVILFYDNGSSGNRRVAEAQNSLDTPAATMYVTWGNGAVPDWQANSGPHSSGSYYYDGVADCFRSSNNMSESDDNDIRNGDNTTSLWFKTDGIVSQEQYLVDWSADSCPNCDYYRIALDSSGKVFFEYNLNLGGSHTVTCISATDYDDSTWWHVIATRTTPGASQLDECALEITDIDGVTVETITDAISHSSSSVDASGKWHVGSNYDEDDKFFKGWIDDLMHWDDSEISNAEKDDLARTNYGTNAHRFDLILDLTDTDGVLVQNLYTGTDVITAFADSKSYDVDDDLAYTQVNMTFNIPQVTVAVDQRLELYFDWKDSTAILESLDVDMAIDDTDMNDPYPSFMQIPFPDNPFPSYYVYDQDDEFRIFIANSGLDGIFLTYQGTRINFNGTNGSYAGLIHSINGTGTSCGDCEWYFLNEDRDSLHIPPGELGETWFYQSTDIPSTDQSGTLIPAGSYHTTVWINGYSDQGETFTRSIVIGTVEVVS